MKQLKFGTRQGLGCFISGPPWKKHLRSDFSKEAIMVIRFMVLFCALFFGTAQAETHTVKAGETLSGIFGKDWKAVCELNNLKDCNKIFVGQILRIPDGNVPSVELTEDGFSPWSVVGGAPLRGCGGKTEDKINEEAWTVLGLTEEEKADLRSMIFLGVKTLTYLHLGERYPAVTFCEKGRVVKAKKIAAWDPQEVVMARTYVLHSGKKVYRVVNCHNWVLDVPEAPKPMVPTIPAKPKPVSPVTPVPPPFVEEKPQPKERIWCPPDPKMVVGQEYEPKHSGNDAHATFLSAAMYCTWRGVKGTHGVGMGGLASWFGGHVNHGAGHFKGNLFAIGPAYEYIADAGYNFEVKLLYGWLDESFKQGDYKSHREFNILGPEVVYNDYRRRIRGEEWFPETQVFASLFFPLSKKARHSWQGIPIEDTSEISEFDAYFNIGVRQWLYEGKYLEPYVQMGFFLESPGAESMSFRLGVADKHRICGVGVGFDLDLKTGGTPFALGWWCDGMRGLEYLRAKHRASQIVEKDSSGGIIMVPLTPQQTH